MGLATFFFGFRPFRLLCRRSVFIFNFSYYAQPLASKVGTSLDAVQTCNQYGLLLAVYYRCNYLESSRAKDPSFLASSIHLWRCPAVFLHFSILTIILFDSTSDSTCQLLGRIHSARALNLFTIDTPGLIAFFRPSAIDHLDFFPHFFFSSILLLVIYWFFIIKKSINSKKEKKVCPAQISWPAWFADAKHKAPLVCPYLEWPVQHLFTFAQLATSLVDFRDPAGSTSFSLVLLVYLLDGPAETLALKSYHWIWNCWFFFVLWHELSRDWR